MRKIKIRIAHICTSWTMYRIIEDKLVRLAKEPDYEIHLICSVEGKDSGLLSAREFLDNLSSHGIILHHIQMNRSIRLFEDVKAIHAMTELLNKEKFDIVHTHNAKAGVIGRLAAKIAGVPMIIHTAHGLPFFEGQNKLVYHVYRYIEIFAAGCSNFIANQNLEDFRKLKKYVPEKKLVYEGNGVDLNLLDEINNKVNSAKIKSLKQRYGIPEKSKIILVGARFEPVKDHHLLIESLKILKERWNNHFCCLLAGNGLLEAKVKERVKECGLEKQVKFIGYQKNIYPWIKMADLLVLTSRKEGIPRILMEGMAFGKAVAATDVLGTNELVVHNETGMLSEYGDAGELALNISLLLDDDHLRNMLGMAGRDRIKRFYNLDTVLERINGLYSKIHEG